MGRLLYEGLTYRIRGVVFNIYKALGPFHKESVYQNSLEQEFTKREIPFEREKILNVYYQGEKVGVYRLDFVIDGKILLEVKAQKILPQSSIKQLYYYLAGTDYRLGLLVNFGKRDSVEVVRRIVGHGDERSDAEPDSV